MTKVRFSAAICADLLFGFADKPVRIVGASFDRTYRCIVFEIEGDDVPDAEEVTAVVSVLQNRAGQQLNTLTFHPIGHSA